VKGKVCLVMYPNCCKVDSRKQIWWRWRRERGK